MHRWADARRSPGFLQRWGLFSVSLSALQCPLIGRSSLAHQAWVSLKSLDLEFQWPLIGRSSLANESVIPEATMAAGFNGL